MLTHTITFKKYIVDNDYKKSLLFNLDKESIDITNRIIENIKKINNYPKSLIPKEYLLSKEELNDKSIEYYQEQFKTNFGNLFLLDYNEIGFDRKIFEYKYGLNDIIGVNKGIEFIKNKDILDCGACHGDTALLFVLFTKFKKIYSFEPNTLNYKILKKVIDNNNLGDSIVPINKGVGQTNIQMYITNNSGASYTNERIGEKIDIVSIDSFVKGNDIKPGLIKWDIEGYELESAIGAEETIRKFKPILLISIYHTGKDFFEIKPLIEGWNLGYKFKIRKNSDHPFAETILICYHDNDENIAYIPNLSKA